jgi:hypothetical protein
VHHSCSNLPVYQVEKEQIYDPETGYSGYDRENGLRWLINYNETHVVMHLDTDDPSTVFKMLNAGLTVYFDPVRARGTSYYLKYPRSRVLQLEKEISTGMDPVRRFSSMDTDELLDLIDTEVIFQNASGKEYLQLGESSDVIVNIELGRSGRLYYYAEIPHGRLGLDQRKEGAKGIYMGFESKGFRSKVTKNYLAERLPNSLRDTRIWFKVEPKN